MSNAYKCDRCGSFFEHDVEAEKDIKYRMVHDKLDIFYTSGHAPVHLCQTCSKALHEWMENKPTTRTFYLKDSADLYINIHRPDPCGEKKRWWKR